MSNIGNGNKGRFSDRLKRMRYNRLYRKKKMELEDGEIMYKNFLKVVAVIPLMVVGNILDNDSDNKKKMIINKKEYIIQNNSNLTSNNQNASLQNKKDKISFERADVAVKEGTTKKFLDVKEDSIDKKNDDVEHLSFEQQNDNSKIERNEYNKIDSEINPIDIKNGSGVSDIISNESGEINQEKIESNGYFDGLNNENFIKDKIENTVLLKKLEKNIINLIKKDLVKIINTLEIYESELYVLSEINHDEKTLNECKKNIAEVRKILDKIDSLKKKYDYLKDNYDFEYLLEVGNEEIIDKITELRDRVNGNEIKTVVTDYKLLDVYKYLYTKVEDIKEKTTKIEEAKQKQEENLKERDIDFEKLKYKVFDINKINDSYASFVSKQNSFLNDLSDSILKIDSHEVVNYEIKGFGKYLTSSFKCLGLIMLNPLKGLFPSIVTQTILARNMVHNLHNSLSWEEKRKTVYEAIDYSTSINYAISNLSYTSSALDSTLDDLAKLKMEYNNKFREYQGDFLEYHDVINKITALQESLINNKIKLEIMKNRMKQYELQNENKLRLVRQLNDNEQKKQ